MSTIRFEQVSKKFLRHHANAADDDLWAVRDVSFECQQGEVLGLVGRNGCGKSTLLKLAAGVTTPTTGRTTTLKPIAPMLELGAGFHPDLTGRDNVKLNASLLGLGRKMTRSEFDEIVAFAELEDHIDTPVKHYSSGMSARLGFAVAVHSTARLLLVDEVLSVGDKLFQQKCLTRMKHLRDAGTTIVLVSHDDWWIRNFCTRALLIDAGRVVVDGTPDQALHQYDLLMYKALTKGTEGIAITSVEVLNHSGYPTGMIEDFALKVRATYDASGIDCAYLLVARVKRLDGVCCAVCIAENDGGKRAGVMMIEISDLHLVAGEYRVEVSMEDANSLEPLAAQISDTVYVAGSFETDRGYEGVMKVRHRWSFE
jgi:ABC-type polysaccharide/polyol phosphate transport system ATPase subunit